MAMNKAEQAMLEEALRQASFRRTMPVERDLPAPKSGEAGMRYTDGWDFNTHTGEAFQSWSTSVSHGTGPAPKEGRRHVSASQGARDLFSTQERALRAMRWAVEEKAATELRKIDKSIAKAMSEQAPAGATS